MRCSSQQAIWRRENIVISIISVLLIVGLCFYLGILYTNQVMITIGYALGMILVLSLLELVYRWFTLKCYIDVPISMSEQGRPINIMLKVRNKGILPAGKVEVRIENKNVFQKKGMSQWLSISDVSIGESKQSVKLLLKDAGCHDILLTHVKIYSLSGFFYLRHKCKDFSSVLILPEVHSMNVQISEAVRNFLGDADVYDDFRPGHDSGETFEIREYREKDKLQSIHWKLSAKMDELMVKENSLPKACAVVLMPEFRPSQTKKWSSKERNVGGYLELIASMSYSLMDQKCPHFVAWYSAQKEGIRRIRVDDEESFYLFLDAYLREAIPVEKNIREEYRKEYKSEWYLHDITMNEKLELYQNGAFLTKLDEKKIKDECEKLELLL